MASIMWQFGEKALINTWLLGGVQSDGTTALAGGPYAPTIGNANDASHSWGVGMGAGVGATLTANRGWNNGASQSNSIAELGQSTAGGYQRNGDRTQNSSRSAAGWPTNGGSPDYSVTGNTITFNFTGTPNFGNSANFPATVWFVGVSWTLGAADICYGADLATTRSFASGDTEKITVTYKQSS